MSGVRLGLVVVVVLLGVLGYSAVFTVYQTEQALILRFGGRSLTDSMAPRTVAGSFCWPGGFNIPYLNQCIMELPIFCAK